MKKNSQIIFAALMMALPLSACSVHATGDDGSGGTIASAPKLDAGLEGTWASGCYYASGAYQTQTLAFHGSAFEGDMALYANSTCTGTPTAQGKATGTYQVVDRDFFETGGYDVNITSTDQSGVTALHLTVTLMIGDKLFLPNASSDDTKYRPYHVDRTRPFSKIGG